VNTKACTVPRYEDHRLRTCREQFEAMRSPEQVAEREAYIASLPAVEWRGPRGDKPPRILRTLRCHGETGRGPHDVHVPESLLWALIDPTRYHCVYHPMDLRGDEAQ